MTALALGTSQSGDDANDDLRIEVAGGDSREWLLQHRHWKRREQQQHLTVMLRGFYQYFALHHCDRRLSWIRHETQRQWKQALQRRGQRRRLSWAQLGDRPWFELPFARNLHPTV